MKCDEGGVGVGGVAVPLALAEAATSPLIIRNLTNKVSCIILDEKTCSLVCTY
jgi:hypothetical protein